MVVEGVQRLREGRAVAAVTGVGGCRQRRAMSPPRTDDLPALAIRRPWLVIVINLLLIIAGVSALLGVEVRELPNIDRPIVAVRADYPGAAPETLDAEVTRVLEAAAARVPGVYLVRSASEEGNLRVIIEFNRGRRPGHGRQRRARCDRARAARAAQRRARTSPS